MAILGLLLAVALCLSSVSAASLGIVQTEGGKVLGYNRFVSGRYIDIFKGIPFAAPPGRFEKPKRHPGWHDVLKAKAPRNKCLQLTLTQIKTRGAEDCLYLNIWVPQGFKGNTIVVTCATSCVGTLSFLSNVVDSISEISTNLPVMVWLYGGAFLIGNAMGQAPLHNLYDGKQIASRGNVIVVSVNYRVGTLGFLSTGDDGIPGNYGLWDQHAAIAWVHRNIHAFGGDPDKVTIFGESAGGASVNLQLISPKNKGLFRRAISQSGAAFCPWAINRNPRAFAEQVARKVNCPTDRTMAACLKNADPIALTLAGSIDIFGSASSPIITHLALSPVIDGDFLPDDPCNLSHNAAEIDYMAGCNDKDGHLFTGFDVPTINSRWFPTSVKKLKILLTALTKGSGPQAADLAYKEYTLNWGFRPTKNEVKTAIVDAETDYFFLVPTQVALHQHSSVATTGRTYSYLFSEPSILFSYLKWMGADHADDLPYVFGKPITHYLLFNRDRRHVSKYMIAYWTNFARTGDPNQGVSDVPVQWPEFNTQTRTYLEINHKMGSGSVKQNLRQRFVNYWNNTYPHSCSQHKV